MAFCCPACVSYKRKTFGVRGTIIILQGNIRNAVNKKWSDWKVFPFHTLCVQLMKREMAPYKQKESYCVTIQFASWGIIQCTVTNESYWVQIRIFDITKRVLSISQDIKNEWPKLGEGKEITLRKVENVSSIVFVNRVKREKDKGWIFKR